jgi:prevent-host-death family protein
MQPRFQTQSIGYNMTMVTDHGRIIVKAITVPAGEFKAKCLKMLDEVAEKRQPLIVTKRGKPLAQVIPMPAKNPSIVGAMKGSVTILGDIISPLDVEWDAMK